ncbi:hypothetical protein ACIBL3_11645 [Kribbella sp. NPDC050124]|uniref:hypothetical protein n=1 Tax=Kribbella sp. NPDC050124 TaxID=3364114 RepID=UPI00378BDB8A
MGLDAFVSCRCWDDGLTTAPPVDPGAIGWEEGGIEFDLPYDGNEDEHLRFETWKLSCCAHPGMEYAAERIGNWASYRQLQTALGEVGWDRFPVLRQVLPDANGGMVESADAAKALTELHEFTASGPIADRAELYDGTTGERIRTEVPAYGGEFMWGPGYRIGFTADGLFVLDGSKQVIFRAHRVGQRVGEGGAWLSDLDHPERGETRVTTSIEGGASPLLVRTGSYASTDFEYTMMALAKVFQASVDTGNPVVWT